MSAKIRRLLVSLMLMFAIVGIASAAERIKTYTFSDITSIDIRTVSGDIKICPGDKPQLMVELKNKLDEPDLLDPRVVGENGKLSIEEHFTGNHVSGDIYWTAYLPISVELQSIKCNSASGNMTFVGFKANSIRTKSASGDLVVDSIYTKEFECSTASGSITVKNSNADMTKVKSASGDISLGSVQSKELELSTASGSITLNNCSVDSPKITSASGDISISGIRSKDLDLTNASGSIMVEDSKIEEAGEISSASGDIELDFPQLPPKGFEASTASSDLILKVPDFGENFSLTLVKREDKGRIKCPFEYTGKSTYRNNEGDDYLMDRYTVVRGKEGPEIELKTHSGTIRIETADKGK